MSKNTDRWTRKVASTEIYAEVRDAHINALLSYPDAEVAIVGVIVTRVLQKPFSAAPKENANQENLIDWLAWKSAAYGKSRSEVVSALSTLIQDGYFHYETGHRRVRPYPDLSLAAVMNSTGFNLSEWMHHE